jgi:putative ABC transport system ATP-binding protein
MTAIRCSQLNKTFTQGDQIICGLNDVSIDIEEGSFVCLSGPSGSGKTTLLNAMGGLDKPDSGEIQVGDKHVDLLGKSDLADMRLHSIGFVFQAYNLIPVLTARENIEFVMQIQGVPTAQRRDKAIAMLEEVGLADHEDRLPSQLSGGQQQRVAVARAIVSGARRRTHRKPGLHQRDSIDGIVRCAQPGARHHVCDCHSRYPGHGLLPSPDTHGRWQNHQR